MAQVKLKEVVNESRRSAVAVSEDGGVQSKISTRGFNFVIDEPPERGGKDEGATPLEHFSASLAACQLVQVNKVAEAMRLNHGAITITANLDTNMVVRDEERNLLLRFTGAEMIIDIETDEPQKKIDRLAELAEDRCPVGALIGDAGIEIKCVWNTLPMKKAKAS